MRSVKKKHVQSNTIMKSKVNQKLLKERLNNKKKNNLNQM